MATYEWVCPKCKIWWDREYKMGTAPDRTRCPECRKLSERKWDVAPPVHFKGAGWTGRNKVTGFNKAGGSDEVNQRLQDQTKERMKSGWQHYAQYTPKDEWMKENVAKKLTEKERANKMEASKKLSDSVYNKAGIDPHDKYKPQ